MRVARIQTGINHHGRRQAAMKITSKLNTINAPVNIDTSFFIISRCNDSANESRTKLASVMPRAACLRNFNCKYTSYLSQNAGHPSKN